MAPTGLHRTPPDAGIAVNATLKALQNLIRNPDPELQLAALRVLGAIKSREPGIHRALGELLVATDDPIVFHAVLDAIDQAPHEQALRYLLRLLERDIPYQDRVLEVIAKIGPKALPALKLQFERVSSATQGRIVAILPRLRTHPAHQMLLDSLAHPNHHVVRAALHAIRDEMPHYAPDEKADLQTRLAAALRDRRFKASDTALSAVIISLGVLADPRAEDILLPFTRPGHPAQIRRHALLSLSRLDLPVDDRPDLAAELAELLDEEDYDGLVRPAVAVLARLRPGKADEARCRVWLKNRHPGVRAFAIQTLAQIDSPANAQLILDFLHHPDQAPRDAAIAALKTMPSAVGVLLKALDQCVAAGTGGGGELVRLLESHPGNRLAPDRARSLVKRMLTLSTANDPHHEWYLNALKTLRPDILLADLAKQADQAFAAGDFATACRVLRLLDTAGLLTDETRYRLAVARLKVSPKDRSRSSRQADYALDHMATLLAHDPKGFRARLFAEPMLDDADLYYVGYHFAERLNEERRFGADVLRHVVAKWPRRAAAKQAKAKLTLEGH